MTASTLHKLVTEDNLQKAWKAFWKASRGSAPGIDGVTPDNFNSKRGSNLQQIYVQLRSKEGYKFSLLRGHIVPKKNGRGSRVICIPTVSDRIVQRLVSAHLCENDKLHILNEVSFGFIAAENGKKRGVRAARDRAIELRTASSWAYKSDISAFFDRIPRQKLVEQTLIAIRTPSFRPLITGVASCEIDNKDPAVNRLAEDNGIKRGIGLRQGMPLSPLFSNVILRDFDNEMIMRKKKLVRYADDFIVLADNEKECLEIDTLARELLAKHGFTIPPLGDENSKTYIAQPDQDIEFLGLALAPKNGGGYHLVITEEQLDKIRRALGDLKNINELVEEDINITKLTQKIEKKISGYQTAYAGAHNEAALKEILQKYRSEILWSIFSKIFGEDKLHALTANQKKFLCLA